MLPANMSNTEIIEDFWHLDQHTLTNETFIGLKYANMQILNIYMF